MQQETNTPVIFCLTPKAAGRRKPLFGLLSRDIATLGDLKKHIKSRTGLSEAEQRFVNAYVDADRLVRLDSKADDYIVKHDTLPNPLRLQSAGKWPTEMCPMGKAETFRWFKTLEQELQKYYKHQFGTSRYLPLFSARTQQRPQTSEVCNEESEEDVAKAKSQLYQYLLHREADELPGQLFSRPLVDMINALAEQERPDLMIDSMDGKDAVKLCYIFNTVSRQTCIDTADMYLRVSACNVPGASTTFRDLLRKTRKLTAEMSVDQKLIELLEIIIRQSETMHPMKVAKVMRELQADGGLWYARCATTLLPCLITQLGDVALASQQEVKIRLKYKPDSPSELYTQMRELLMPKLDSLDNMESWVCMDILQNCDNEHILSGGFMMVGLQVYTITGETSVNLYPILSQTMELHKKMSVKPGLGSVNKMFSILAAKHGETFSVATQLRCFKIMYQNALQ